MCEHRNNPCGREAAMITIERDGEGVPSIWCDPCIAPLVIALNAAGLSTISSCCGHGEYAGWVILRDGREIVIYPDHESNLAANDPALLKSVQPSDAHMAAAATRALRVHDTWGTVGDPDGKTRPMSDYTALSSRMAEELRG